MIIREKNRENRCTSRTKGKVIKYYYNSGVNLPVVEYIVDNIRYKGKFKYSLILTISSPFKKGTKIESNIFDPNLKISRNSIISFDTLLREHFPIGTELDVYYDPYNPKLNYVVRFTKNLMGRVFLLISFIFLTMVIILFVILRPY